MGSPERVAGAGAPGLLVRGLLAVLLYATAWLALGVAVTSAFGLSPVLIGSGSMNPLIRPGDVVMIAGHEGAGLAPGTVITYEDPSFGGRLVTHRIAAVTEQGSYVTQGDANAGPDSDLVLPAAVVGTGRLVFPYVGLPVHWLHEGHWPALLGWLAATVVALTSLLDRGPRPPRRRDRSKDGHRRRRPSQRRTTVPAPGLSALFALVLAPALAGAGVLGVSAAAFTGVTGTGAGLGAGEWTALDAVAAGHSHACSSRHEGVVRCWGAGTDGQLGTGTGDLAVPVVVTGPAGSGLLDGVTDLDAGGATSCAVTAAGQAWCWGRNDRGQLGDGSLTSSSAPVRVSRADGSPLGAVTRVSVGDSHACALLGDGTAWCWGGNTGGVLGDGTTQDRTRPVQVVGMGGSGTLSGVVAVSAGSAHTCAATSTGNVRCWGSNGSGRLGSLGGDSPTPVAVVGSGGVGVLGDATGVTAGAEHTCAPLTDGTLSCWGSNDSGRLGRGGGLGGPVPARVVAVSGLGSLTQVVGASAGAAHTCAARSGGDAVCWGVNTDGRLGDGTTTDRSRPVAVVGPGGSGTLAAVRLVAAGDSSSCAARTDETLWCWGSNARGQLGDGTTVSSSAPVLAH